MGWKSPHTFPVTTSTNDEAIRRAKEGGEEGEVFIADHQTAGRGRAGRHWESPAGKNLYLSVLLRPTCPPAQAPLLTLVAGAASHEALSSFLPPSASLKIKWPNDLYLNGKKVAGILSEMESEGDHIRWVVTGIGIDVNADEADFSPEVRKIATSLKIASNKEIDRQAVAGRFIEAFQKRYRLFLSEGPAPTIAFCNQHSYLKGRRVTIDGLTGTAMDLNASGHLEIKTDDGKIVPIASGDVALAGKVSD